ncbi:Pre-mRNA cleavage complex 2 protein Pcf11 [Armadillidium vulgare]|nr:Pre-mRNA cleavage complex 2 protein Pcf11 [Armadillidium vulgare]
MSDLNNMRQLKIEVIEGLHNGIPCSNCGLRFSGQNQSKDYSKHLDWHFRQNRNMNKSTRHTRSLFYTPNDWVKFGEDEEESVVRAKTVFEIQKEGPGVEEEKKESSFPLSENDPSPICPMCHEDFKVYFNDDEDCWHLKNAIRKDGILFHPSCYDDHLKILRRQKERDAKHNCARIKEEKI